MSKYLSVKYLLLCKKTGALQIIDIWGVHLGGGTPKLCQNICLLNIYCYQKETSTLG